MFKQSFNLFRTAFSNEKTAKKNLIITLILEVVAVAGIYYLNETYGALYDGIQNYDTHKIVLNMSLFAGIAGILVFVEGFASFFLSKLAFSIREGLNTYYTAKFAVLSSIENIEQRIQEDLKAFGEKSCNFWVAVLRSVLKVPLFVGVVITLTQWWVGLVLVASVLIGTWLTKVVARKLIALQAEQESNEATYRKGVTLGVFEVFMQIKECFGKINSQIKKLSFLQSGLSQTFVLLPFVILMPLYITKKINMGALMQASSAMGSVIDSLTVLIDNRSLIVSISTCLLRMETLAKEEEKATTPELKKVA